MKIGVMKIFKIAIFMGEQADRLKKIADYTQQINKLNKSAQLYKKILMIKVTL